MRSIITLKVLTLVTLLPNVLSSHSASIANFRGKYSLCRLTELGGLDADIKLLILPRGLFNNSDRVPNYQNYISNFMIFTANSKLWDISAASLESDQPRLFAINTNDSSHIKHTLASALQARAAFVYSNDTYIAINEELGNKKRIMVHDGNTKLDIPVEAPSGELLLISPMMDRIGIHAKNSQLSFSNCHLIYDKLNCSTVSLTKRQGDGMRTSQIPLFIIKNSTPELYFVLFNGGQYFVYKNLNDIMSNQTSVSPMKHIRRAKVDGCVTTTAPSTIKRNEPSPWAWVTPIVVIILIFVTCLSCVQYYK